MDCSWFSCNKSGGESSEVDGGEIAAIDKVKIYKYEEIRQATDDFNAVNKIGEGHFGYVYKGLLKDGKIVAIKVLLAETIQGVGEFLTEINVIYEIQHENLVELYGCCVEENHRILVYNYLDNNSLEKTLLAGGYTRSGIQFDWSTRANICIGMAKGLAFLHEEVRPHVIHGDIKASNILLDKDLSPKISDFGLTRLIPANRTHVIVDTRVADAIGYVAPEYAFSGQLLQKADIYSFGVFLMEIVSGRSNTDTRLLTEYQYLLEVVWDLYERNELVDSGLNGVFDAEEVVQLLRGEKEVDYKKINKPGLISDFMYLKVRGLVETTTKPGETKRHSNYTNPSSSSSRTRDNSNA